MFMEFVTREIRHTWGSRSLAVHHGFAAEPSPRAFVWWKKWRYGMQWCYSMLQWIMRIAITPYLVHICFIDYLGTWIFDAGFRITIWPLGSFCNTSQRLCKLNWSCLWGWILTHSKLVPRPPACHCTWGVGCDTLGFDLWTGQQQSECKTLTLWRNRKIMENHGRSGRECCEPGLRWIANARSSHSKEVVWTASKPCA